jgi:hypothetical protein
MSIGAPFVRQHVLQGICSCFTLRSSEISVMPLARRRYSVTEYSCDLPNVRFRTEPQRTAEHDGSTLRYRPA